MRGNENRCSDTSPTHRQWLCMLQRTLLQSVCLSMLLERNQSFRTTQKLSPIKPLVSQHLPCREFHCFPCNKLFDVTSLTKALVPGASVDWPFLSTDSGANCLDLPGSLSPPSKPHILFTSLQAKKRRAPKVPQIPALGHHPLALQCCALGPL